MKSIYLLFISVAISSLLFSSCNSESQDVTKITKDFKGHHVVVTKVVQSNSYTYIQANEGEKEHWLAVSKMNPQVGDDLYYAEALEMKDFKSKALDRVFERILFIDKIVYDPSKLIINTPSPTVQNYEEHDHEGHNHDGHKHSETSKTTESTLSETINITPEAGGISIEALYAQRNEYAQKTVIVKGKVVKVNKAIMNKNWVHLKDGTGAEGTNDLTFTTLDNVEVGDIVTMEGTLELDRTYGPFSYEIIVENSSIKQ